MENDDLQQELDRVLADFVPGVSRTVAAAETTSYKGLSVPANSALLKQDASVLSAYRSLLAENNANNNGNVPSIVDAQLSALPLFLTAPNSLSFNVQLLINTLPVLDNLATQILRIITKCPYQKVMELVSNRDSSYSGIAFSNLVELFETTKRVYNSEESPFFTVENITFGLWSYGESPPAFLRGREDTIEGTLRKVNLATFLLATLGLIDLGFFFLNEAFLDVFCPPQNLDPAETLSNLKQNDPFILNDIKSASATSKLFTQQRASTKFLKQQALLFLELKTQAYISALELGDRSKEEIISDLFPEILPELLLRRRDIDWKSKLENELNGGKLSDIVSNGDFTPSSQIMNRVKIIFTPAEYDFLQRCTLRKASLLKESTSKRNQEPKHSNPEERTDNVSKEDSTEVSDEENKEQESVIEPINLADLMSKYEWVRFLNDLLDYVSRNVGFLIWGPKGKISVAFEKKRLLSQQQKKSNETGNLKTSLEGVIKTEDNTDSGAANDKRLTDDKADRSSSKETENPANNKRTSSEAGLDDTSAANTTKDLPSETIAAHDPASIPEQDKLVSTESNTELISNEIINKPSAVKKPKNRPATFRRVWTEAEESALREGLKSKGTQWTAILELFGPGGRVNESLKNRTSLQLKDKARNWKLWYIKNNVEVPDWLMGATGSLNKVSKPGTPLDGEQDSSNDDKQAKQPKKIIKKPTKKQKLKEQTEADTVSEDQYDEMLSILAKSADNNHVIGSNDNEEHQENPNIDEQLTNPIRNDQEAKLPEANKDLETDDHTELKNLVAEAFQ